ncbi:MAG TPA: hypothetical protein VGR87_06200 [Candidatus Limnocylindria bacterium]|jgi:hypothetical protein|nr:hypothetical protein [Candidatus Limnocylindria bacterium]
MRQRDALLVLGAVILAVGISAILLVSSLGSAATASGGPRRIFFDARNPPPAARTIVEAQRELPAALQPIAGVQRRLADTARDAAFYLLILLGTSAALVLAREQVVSTYRASLGGWRAQLRVLGSGLAVIGIGASAAALSWIVFLGSVSSLRSAGFLGVPAALQVGLAVFSVTLAVAGLATLVGFAAASWRLGDALFQLPRVRRYAASVPAPLIALLGATLIYVAWQIPYIGALAVVGAIAYALGAVVTARLAHSNRSQVTTSPHAGPGGSGT